jgi:hypothetical protein
MRSIRDSFHLRRFGFQVDPVMDPDGYTADRVAYTAWVEARGTTLYTRGIQPSWLIRIHIRA